MKNLPTAFTDEFFHFVQAWDVVVVWDKDHTMVDHENVLRPNLETVILKLKKDYPSWKHVIMTENTMFSVMEMFENCPAIGPIFDMILCEDNYFSKKIISKFLRAQGYWWPWGKRVRQERMNRKRRRVNDIFLGKKVILIDDLRDGRIPEHSFCVTCRVWTGEASHEDEINWPKTIPTSILRILKKLYNHIP